MSQASPYRHLDVSVNSIRRLQKWEKYKRIFSVLFLDRSTCTVECRCVRLHEYRDSLMTLNSSILMLTMDTR